MNINTLKKKILNMHKANTLEEAEQITKMWYYASLGLMLNLFSVILLFAQQKDFQAGAFFGLSIWPTFEACRCWAKLGNLAKSAASLQEKAG